MEVGDSFIAPIEDVNKIRAYSGKYVERESGNKKFSTISYPKEGICRTWRIK
jgi:hypothetical protein